MPTLIKPEQEYSAHLAEGRFMLLRSRTTETFLFYPRVAAPGTGDRDLLWVEASGGGVVYSTTVIHPKQPERPFNVALIDLDEGPRMLSRVDGIDVADVRIGMPVRAEIIIENGEALVVFVPDVDGGKRP